MTTTRTFGIAGVVLALAAPPLVAAAPAWAHGGGGGVRTSGMCSNGSATYELKAKHDDARIEIEFEVDTNRAGQVWHVRITDNGRQVVSRNATTKAPSGSFTVSKRTADSAGRDMIRARATRGQQVCHAHLTV